MKILIAHNTYRHAGGEETVVDAERALLASHGHDVGLFSASNHTVTGLASRIGTAIRAPYSARSRDALARHLEKDRPDLVHVHNFFPLLTPAIYDACRTLGVPVVQTLHNYRLICPTATLMRGGKVCELCVTGSAYQSVLHGCYRGSRPGTLAVARLVEYHRRHGTWGSKVDRYIALTDFAKGRFVAGGFPADRIAVKPNFAADTAPPDSDAERGGALFVGRLSPEKGPATLVEACRDVDMPVRIAGDGPLSESLRAAAPATVSFAGRLTPDAIAEEMRRAAFLVVPSQCYEGFPMAIAEAFAAGLPVFASRLGSLAEIIEDGVNGLLFAPGDTADLAAKLRWAGDHPDELRRMGVTARQHYEERYTPEVNYAMLESIYRQVTDA